MNDVFFYYLVPLKESLSLLNDIDLHEEDKSKLHEMIHSMYEHRVTEVILENLPLSDHEDFVKKLSQNPFDLEIMSYLKNKNSDIDSIIQEAGNHLHNEIIALITIK